MKLADYLALTKTSISGFADKIEVKQQTCSRYVSGSRIPHPSVMTRIVAATKGAVQPNDFYVTGPSHD